MTPAPSPPADRRGRRPSSWILALAAAAGLALFYIKYVPLVPAYQAALTPILLFAAFLGWRDLRRGALFFLFALPLINSLPYFFGLHEPLPHAPAALVLGLFFLFGALLGGRREGDAPASSAGLREPLALFAALVVVSALITILRYTDFFPFLSPGLYEWKVSAFGVGSGAAVMSVVFTSLTYLTGIALFRVLRRAGLPSRFPTQALTALGSGTLLSLAFAAFQHFGRPAFGNNPTSLGLGLINGTYKDAMSMGAFVSMAVPLFGGVFLASRDVRLKALAALIVVPGALVVVWSGSKISLAGLLTGAVVLAGLALAAGRRPDARPGPSRAKPYALLLPALLLIGGAIAGLVPGIRPSGDGRKPATIVERFKESGPMLRWRIEAMWKPALTMLAAYPLTGVGVGAYIIEVPHYFRRYKGVAGYVPESAENYGLQLGSELGLPGLALVLWIGGALFRRARRAWRAPAESPGGPARLLAAGAIAGLAAFLVGAQMHSYIGAYEVKYLLWFLIAILPLRPSDPAGTDAGACAPGAGPTRGRQEKRLSSVSLGLLLVFGVLLLWSSTHSLSLWRRTADFKLVQEFGLGPAEKTPDGREFRWTEKHAGVPIEIGKPVLIVPVQAAHPDIVERPVRIRFDLVESLSRRPRKLGEAVLADHDWRAVELPVAAAVGHPAVLLITVDRTWNPRRALGIPDPRDLGVAIGAVAFRGP
jgi:hypothetical protein